MRVSPPAARILVAGLALAAAYFAVLPAGASAAGVRAPSVFVAPNGSDGKSCRSRAAACATFNRAYRVARPGQVVEVAGGRYPRQSIRAAAGKKAPNIVFRPARRASVVVTGISFG